MSTILYRIRKNFSKKVLTNTEYGDIIIKTKPKTVLKEGDKMLNNLKAELVRKGYDEPVEAVRLALDCTDRTARNKLNGSSPFTVPEAVKIKEKYFSTDTFSMEYLFVEAPA